jgi:hypothetical protein
LLYDGDNEHQLSIQSMIDKLLTTKSYSKAVVQFENAFNHDRIKADVAELGRHFKRLSNIPLTNDDEQHPSWLLIMATLHILEIISELLIHMNN